MHPIRTFLKARYGRPYSPARLATTQRQGFARLRREIMPKSPFYAAYAEQPFEQWPQMNKARLMQNFGQINTVGLQANQALDVALRAEASRDFSSMIGQIALGLSTGTSGQRGLFATNPRERQLWAALMLGRFMPRLWARQRVAFFLRANNRLYQSLSNPLIEFRFYDLLQEFEAQLPGLAQQNPTVLIAPAQILGLLAQAQRDGRLALAPQVVISVAEVASPEDAALIGKAFGRPLDQVYQCTEGVLGMTCAAGQLHLNEDFLHIEREVIDPATGAFIPIITDLSRQTLPIIRYRLDDVLVPDPRPCPCGCARLRLARIEGRCDDILYWSGRDGARKMIPSDAIRQAIAASLSPVRDYRCEQFGPAHLRITLDAAARAAPGEITAKLAKQAQERGAILPQLSFHFGIAPSPDRKRRRVINRPLSEFCAADLPTADLGAPDISAADLNATVPKPAIANAPVADTTATTPKED